MTMTRSTVRDVRRVVARGIMLPMRKQNSNSSVQLANYCIRGEPDRAIGHECHLTESQMEYAHIARHSIDGLHPPQLGATLTVNALLLEEAATGKRFNRPWNCCSIRYSPKGYLKRSSKRPFPYVDQNLIVPPNPQNHTFHTVKERYSKREGSSLQHPRTT